MCNIIKHFNTVNKHRWYVFIAMCQCHKPIQGMLHDLSKYNPIEFFESVKYYNGVSSPLQRAKNDKGYSNAYFHHMGRNKHHSVYWVDCTWGKIKPAKMPYRYVVEHICDTIGAGKAYMGNVWNNTAPLDWWYTHDYASYYHDITRKFVLFIYKMINLHGWKETAKILRKKEIKAIYEKSDNPDMMINEIMSTIGLQ